MTLVESEKICEISPSEARLLIQLEQLESRTDWYRRLFKYIYDTVNTMLLFATFFAIMALGYSLVRGEYSLFLLSVILGAFIVVLGLSISQYIPDEILPERKS